MYREEGKMLDAFSNAGAVTICCRTFANVSFPDDDCSVPIGGQEAFFA